jgi:hypothetical protein
LEFKLQGRGAEMPINLFGPNIAKLRRTDDVDGLLRVIRRDKSGAAEIQHKKDAVDALCSMSGAAVQAILDLYADGEVGPVVRDYLSLHAKEASAFERSPELVRRHVEGLVHLVRRDRSWTAETQTKKDAVDALGLMGDAAVQEILALSELDEVWDYLKYHSKACEELLKTPEVADAVERIWGRNYLLYQLKHPPVGEQAERGLREKTRAELDWIASRLDVETDPRMTDAELIESILAGRVDTPAGQVDRVLAVYQANRGAYAAAAEALRKIPGVVAFTALINCMGDGAGFAIVSIKMEHFAAAIIARAAEAGAANDASVVAPLQGLLKHRVHAAYATFDQFFVDTAAKALAAYESAAKVAPPGIESPGDEAGTPAGSPGTSS